MTTKTNFPELRNKIKYQAIIIQRMNDILYSTKLDVATKIAWLTNHLMTIKGINDEMFLMMPKQFKTEVKKDAK